MTLNTFLHTLEQHPENIDFTETMAVIDSLYHFTETAFNNGEPQNAAGENNGSCKLFAFAMQQGFTPAQTLACFGQYYRHDVLQNPGGDNHQNIRQFMASGWEGIQFSQVNVLEKK